MPEYALLVAPSSNRVYADAAARLTLAELAVFDRAGLGGRLSDLADTGIGGVPYVTFRADRLDERDVALLSNLSSRYALFERVGDLLRPLPVTPLDRFDSDLLTIQKYAGKTNEHFTKLLLNVTVLATGAGLTGRKLRIMDPLCGRGTTLDQAIMYGYDAAGVELDGKDFDAYAVFLRTWLKNKRLKHRAELTTLRRERAVAGRRLHVTLGASKDEYRAGETIDVDVVHADTRQSRRFFKAATFDAVVTDAPYGVQHGSRTADKLSRSPLDLLAEAVPVWAELVRPGGAVGISWNTFVGKRDDLAAILTAAGLAVCDGPGYDGFRHRVDQAIMRDLIVATKPAAA